MHDVLPYNFYNIIYDFSFHVNFQRQILSVRYFVMIYSFMKAVNNSKTSRVGEYDNGCHR